MVNPPTVPPTPADRMRELTPEEQQLWDIPDLSDAAWAHIREMTKEIQDTVATKSLLPGL